MGITYSKKSIEPTSSIQCNGTVDVTIALTAAPDTVTNPTDIVLVLDRSESMENEHLENLKSGVNTFIDTIAQSTGGTPDEIGSGSHIGIVSFATEATKDTDLISSVSELKQATDVLVADGLANHFDALTAAVELLETSANPTKVIVIFTEGRATRGASATPIVNQAKENGIIIYCIGLPGKNGLEEQDLIDWASEPTDEYILISPTSDELEKTFASLAKNTSIPGATNILIDEIINSDFKILKSTISADLGKISNVTDDSFHWKINKLGTNSEETATVTFTIKHISTTTGVKYINEELIYSDSECNQPDFGNPSILVSCGSDIIADSCPIPVNIELEGCNDFYQIDAGNALLESTGSLISLDINLKNVCPNKRVALAVILTEIDTDMNETPVGFKTYVIPAHDGDICADILVKCIRFILTSNGGLECETRNLRAEFFAHYIDTDARCCPSDE